MTTQAYTNVVKKASETCPYSPKTPQALEWTLDRLGIGMRYNVRSHATEWRRGGYSISADGPFDDPVWVWHEWEILTQRGMSHIRNLINIHHKVNYGRDAFTDTLDAMLYHLEIDPLLGYFESLPKVTGRNILPKALSTCMNVTEGYEGLAEWASVYMFLGVVWRTFKPGTKLDEIPILVGPGAIGKSTFPALAVPQHIPGLYTSGLELNANAKTKVEALQGKALLEISEMIGAQASEMGKIKDYISRTDDGAIRLSFRRDPEPMPRRCVLMGTADRAHFLPPDNNHRRFVPVVLGRGDARKVRRYMDKNRERLWCEAVAMYRNNIPAHLPESLKDRALEAVQAAVW